MTMLSSPSKFWPIPYCNGEDELDVAMFEVGGLRFPNELQGLVHPDDIPDRSQVEPLASVRVYFNVAQGGHWHYLTLGFSDLYAYECGNEFNASGFGFELSLRIPAGDDEAPPGWPIEVFQYLAEYVFRVRTSSKKTNT